MVEISLTRQEICTIASALGDVAGRIEVAAQNTALTTFDQIVAWKHDAERLRQLAKRLTSEMHEREAA